MASPALVLAAALALGQPLAEAELLARIALPGQSNQGARRLLAADELAAQKKWAEAVEHYQRIIREGGDDLVPIDSRRSLQARWLCDQRLARLPPEALRLYRTQVNNQARRWLDQGIAEQDAGVLRHLVDEAFCSRFTDQALDLLGDLSFERGAFDEAEYWWRLLALPASEKDRPESRSALTFPDPRVDLARVRAKEILSLLFGGRPAAAEQEWLAFQQLHSAAAGQLGGRKGNYAQIVQDLIAAEGAQAPRVTKPGWLTFAGDPTRNFIAPTEREGGSGLPALDRPTWDRPLQPAWSREPSAEGSQHPLRDARGLVYYPVIAGNRVLVSDAGSVRGYELLTGRPIFEYRNEASASDEGTGTEMGRSPQQFLRTVAPADLAYTLTVEGEQLYARLGATGTGSGRDKVPPTFLVCLDLRGANSTVERWKIKPAPAGNHPAFFEGSPIAHAGSVYAALTRLTGVDTITSVACYAADTGTLRWQRDVCSTQELRDGEQRHQHHLLTLAGPSIVYCSHSGAIVALDAATGRPIWGMRYPSRGPRTLEGNPSPRALAPCLYYSQRLYLAPSDYDRILCLDASTGQPLWESTNLETVHLLGVARGQIIFSSTTPRPCLRALDLIDGNPVPGWLFPWSGKLTPFGRGLLAGNQVLWPTWEEGGRLCLLDQGSGELVQVAHGLVGNLAMANGCLVAADLDRLSAYISESLLLSRPRAEGH
jgi:outer membrane protein assembly factor BamB